MKKMRYFIFILLWYNLILQCECSNAQDRSIEESYAKIVELSYFYSDSALTLAKNEFKRAIKIREPESLGLAYGLLGRIQIDNGLYEEAIVSLDTALKFKSRFKKLSHLCSIYSNLGSAHLHLGNYPEAISFFNKAIEIADEDKDLLTIGFSFRSLSKISSIQENHQDALKYLNTLKEKYPKISNKKEEGLLFHSFAEYYGYIGDKTLAITNFSKAYDIFEKNNYHYSKAWTQSSWALQYAESDLNKCLIMLLGAQKVFNSVAPKSTFSINNLGNIAEVFRMFATDDKLQKKFSIPNIKVKPDILFAESEKYFKLALKYAKASNAKTNEMILSGNLANLYSNIGNYKLGFEYLYIYHNLSDSIFSQKNKNRIAYLINEKRILDLNSESKRKSYVNYFLISLSFALLIIGYLLVRNFLIIRKIQRNKIAKLEIEKKQTAMEAQLQGQIEERVRIAQDLHDGLGGMLNGVKYSISSMKENLVMTYEDSLSFENSISQMDKTISELRRISHNLMPDSLVKNGLKNAILDFCSSMGNQDCKVLFQTIGEEIEITGVKKLHIYRIFQELVNNAIHHGKATSILAQLSYNSDRIMIDVEDNGIGFDIKGESIGLGFESIRHRIDYFNGSIDIRSKINDGTSVNIVLAI
jgi:two-component system, NarL family, sensor kinase